MVRIIFIAIFHIATFVGKAQYVKSKPPLDTTVFGKWPYPSNVSINSNGKYSQYWLNNPLQGVYQLVIRSNDGPWKHTFDLPLGSMNFSADGRYSVFLQQGDSLAVVTLGCNIIRYFSQVYRYQVLTGSWIMFTHGGMDPGLRIINLRTGLTRDYPVVSDYLSNQAGIVVLLRRKDQQNAQQTEAITWIQVASGKQRLLWMGYELDGITFDKSGTQIAFTGQKEQDIKASRALYIYRWGQDSAHWVAGNESAGLKEQYQLEPSGISFNDDGTIVVCRLHAVDEPPSFVYSENADPIIWNYLDSHRVAHLSDPQQEVGRIKAQYWAAVELNTGKVKVLNQRKELVKVPYHWHQHLLITSNGSYLPDDYYYNNYDAESAWAVDCLTGQRTKLGVGNEIGTYCQLSPSGSFAVWFDSDSLTWYSYELKTGKRCNLSKQVPVLLYDTAAARRGIRVPQGISGWGSDGALYLYDPHDIWSVDLRGRRRGFSLTNGYGARNGITFSMSDIDTYAFLGEKILAGSLLSAYDRNTKKNGIWGLRWGRDPIRYCMDNYCYNVVRVGITAFIEAASGMAPVRAGNSKVYLVQRQSAEEFPNYYWTHDFKKFTPITDLHPEKRYNWVQTELVNWQLPTGQWSQGILYKPENLDTTHRYPVIFDYYAKRSDELHKYIEPDYSGARINIPYYVSNGYLVFVPDIWQQPGKNGQGAVDAVVSAATRLAQYSWVDTTHMGLQGHSFGGLETNYLVAHTIQFAAACSAAGISDDISFYGEVGINLNSHFYETILQGSPYGLGVTPWTRPELYEENTSILAIKQAKTPLLIMQGDKDPAVPFAQALEMFLDMRRAGKKVWMLEYPHSGHVLNDNYAKDFTIRMKQFFDHYLLGKPAPQWMADPMDRYGRKKDHGYELDETGKEP